MAKFFVPTAGVDDWRALLADPEKQWRRGYSAFAAASAWEEAQSLPPEVAAILGQDAEVLLAIPEHKVPLPGGQRESQCDVFALVRRGDETVAVSIEAKVNEPFGPTVGDWLRDASSGKIERLTAICEMLGLGYPPPADLRYQLFHRTAAAIIEARRFNATSAAMIVHSFSQEHRWFEDFAQFCAALCLEAGRGTASATKIPDGRDLILGWATGDQRHIGDL
jgi:hypothetical protein